MPLSPSELEFFTSTEVQSFVLSIAVLSINFLPTLYAQNIITQVDYERISNTQATSQERMLKLWKILQVRLHSIAQLISAFRQSEETESTADDLERLFNEQKTVSHCQAILDDASFLQSMQNISSSSSRREVVRHLKESYIRAFSRFKPMPTIDEVLFDMDDIFVSLTMEQLSSTDSPPMNYDSCLVQVLHIGSLIICKGEPAAGKTTMVNKICYDWAKGMWKEFDLVLCCKLREAQKSENILTMVLKWMAKLGFLRQKDISFIRNVEIKSTPVGTSLRWKRFIPFFKSSVHMLLILDGYDEVTEDLCSELTNILKSVGSTSLLPFALLLTSRPGAVNGDNVKCNAEFVRLLRFDREKQSEYIANHFKRDPQKKHKSMRIEAELENHRFLQELAENPLSLCLICLIHEKLGKINSLSQLYETFIGFLIARGKSKGYPVEKHFSDDWKVSERIRELSQMAFHGLLNGQTEFSITDLRMFGIHSICIALALLIQDERFGELALKVYDIFYYVHKSMQEFYSAFYLDCIFLDMAQELPEPIADDIPETFYSHPDILHLIQSSRSKKVDLDNVFNFMADFIKRNANIKETDLWCRLLICLDIGRTWWLNGMDNDQFEARFMSKKDLLTNGSSAVDHFLSTSEEGKRVPLIKQQNSHLLWNPAENNMKCNFFFSVPDDHCYITVPAVTAFTAKPHESIHIVVTATSINRAKHTLLPQIKFFHSLYMIINEPVVTEKLSQYSLGSEKLFVQTVHLIVGGSDSGYLNNICLSPLMKWLEINVSKLRLDVNVWNCNLLDFDEAFCQMKRSAALQSIVFHRNAVFSSNSKCSLEQMAKVIKSRSNNTDCHLWLSLESKNIPKSEIASIFEVGTNRNLEYYWFKGNDGTITNHSFWLIGGNDNHLESSVSSIEYYFPDDLAHNQIIDCELNCARQEHFAALHNGAIYVVGGMSDGIPLNSTEIIDPVQMKWCRYGPEMKHKRYQFAGVTIDDQLMVFGGYDEHQLLSCESFDIKTGSWSSLPDMRHSRSEHTAVELDGRAYLLAGIVDETISSVVSIFDPNTALWFCGPSLNHQRSWAASTKFGSNIAICGGFDDKESTLNSCEILDPRVGKWMGIESMGQPRCNHALVDYHGRLFAVGGLDEYLDPLSTVEEYDPRFNKWFYVGQLKAPLSHFSVVVLP